MAKLYRKEILQEQSSRAASSRSATIGGLGGIKPAAAPAASNVEVVNIDQGQTNASPATKHCRQEISLIERPPERAAFILSKFATQVLVSARGVVFSIMTRL